MRLRLLLSGKEDEVASLKLEKLDMGAIIDSL
jgi:hypothetical protein